MSFHFQGGGIFLLRSSDAFATSESLALPAPLAALAVAMLAFAARGPATASPWRAAVLGGGLVGLLIFGSWNLMNYAWLPGWPLAVVLVDTSWHIVCGL